jgi:hypothetical protein
MKGLLDPVEPSPGEKSVIIDGGTGMPDLNDFQEAGLKLHDTLHLASLPVPMDLKSTNDVLDKMEGLEVNRISAAKCCFHPEGLAHMIEGVRTKTMLHICTGCYGQALQNMPRDRSVDILMLPDFVERAMEQ